ncbi:hypothetical protein E2C01_055712 [Portunus trituberculatus]|uniref:Uncharacterized protein n=1 Tax=Portunus trituberculatus TaxID=210409 RepID=A0A5B7GXQ0_PORTR|nr:hypothetical protein [Portunus trituberculatus]
MVPLYHGGSIVPFENSVQLGKTVTSQAASHTHLPTYPLSAFTFPYSQTQCCLDILLDSQHIPSRDPHPPALFPARRLHGSDPLLYRGSGLLKLWEGRGVLEL